MYVISSPNFTANDTEAAVPFYVLRPSFIPSRNENCYIARVFCGDCLDFLRR